MKFILVFPLLVALTAASCRCRDNSETSQANAQYAILRGTKYPKAGHTFASHINGQPTSFWRSGDRFLLRAGTNTCDAAYSDRNETVEYARMLFVAVPGVEYVIVRKREPTIAAPLAATPHPARSNAWAIQDRRDRAVIYQNTPGGSQHVIAVAPKEDYVFGFSTSDS